MQCVVCGNKDDFSLYLDKSRRLKPNEKIYYCNECQFKFVYPRNNLLIDENWNNQDSSRKLFGNDHKDRDDVTIKNGNRYFDHVEKDYFLENKNNNSIKYLDIGSGYSYCSFLSKLKYNKINLNLLEVADTVEKGINFFGSKFPESKEILNNINTINTNIEDYKTDIKYNIITMWHVLEHVFEPNKVLDIIYDLLDDNGVFLLEIPNDDDDLNYIDEFREITHFSGHVNYFNKNSFLKSINNSKFKNSIVKIEGVQRYGFYNYVDWIRYESKKNVFSDDYGSEPRNKLEQHWLDTKIKDLKCDTLYIKIVKK